MAAPNAQTTPLPSASAAQQALGLWNPAAGWYDAPQGEQLITLLASMSRSGTITSAVQVNPNARGVTLVLNVSSVGTGNLTMHLNGTVVAGADLTIAISVAITATGDYVLTVYPGANGGGANLVVSAPLPYKWYVSIVPSDGSTWGYALYALTYL